MTNPRSLLRPIRTRRLVHSITLSPAATLKDPTLTPGTRKTLATIGALWVSFALSASASASAPVKATADGRSPRTEPDER